MASFLARRLGAMLLTMLCLTLAVFYLVNLEPNLRKLAISQTEMHASDQELESWLVKNGYRRPFFVRYATWLGVWPKEPKSTPRPARRRPLFLVRRADDARFSGRAPGRFRLLHQVQGKGRRQAGARAGGDRILMFWVMASWSRSRSRSASCPACARGRGPTVTCRWSRSPRRRRPNTCPGWCSPSSSPPGSAGSTARPPRRPKAILASTISPCRS